MAPPIGSWLDAFAQVGDPRKARGVRHPYTSLLALTSLGLLCRQTDMASLRRWAEDHRRVLKGALGFTRKRPPHATTISRAVARFPLGQFRDAFARRLVSLPGVAEAVAAAVDGKTSKQGRGADGDPVHMLNVFAHEVNLCLAQSPVTGGKPTEPQALKGGLGELLEHYPFLRLFTADALFAQRPLARVILEAERDFPFAVKDNQPDLLEAIRASSAAAAEGAPDARAVGKKGARPIPASSGSSTANRSTTPVRRPSSPASGRSCGSTSRRARSRARAGMRPATWSPASRATRPARGG